MLAAGGRSDPALVDTIVLAAERHDLGKLDPDNQAALRRGPKTVLPVDHVDAGVASCMAAGDQIAALLVRAHHAPGLPDLPAHFRLNGRKLRGRRRDDVQVDDHRQLRQRTDGRLESYLEQHGRIAPTARPRPNVIRDLPPGGLQVRLALSCLVDADHSDVSTWFGHPEPCWAKPRWSERLAALDAYVETRKGGGARTALRSALYDACRSGEPDAPVVTCQAPVGTGKTTAVLAWLIKRAMADGLRRIFVVAPRVTILGQTATVLREALVLPGEDPDQVIFEHHHLAEFQSLESRHMTASWRAPIVLTTAVQFFGTLASNRPVALRKLHDLPGSGVFIDEAHAALPPELWHQNWLWLRQLSSEWGCRIALVSGSLCRFWETSVLPEAERLHERLPELLPSNLAVIAFAAEADRVHFVRPVRPFATVEDLAAAVWAEPGPRVVVLNTVRSAATVARRFRDLGMRVLHLSTALCPRDRARMMTKLDAWFRSEDQDWVLVATSSIEAGVDLSFRSGFRERASVASLIQLGGRINRNFEWETGGVVWDFRIDSGAGITTLPVVRRAAEVLERLDPADLANEASGLVTQAMLEELVGDSIGGALAGAEQARRFPEVARLGRVIDRETKLVIVDDRIWKRIAGGETVPVRDLLAVSVPLSRGRGMEDNISELVPGLHRWTGRYDADFLGIMADDSATIDGEAGEGS